MRWRKNTVKWKNAVKRILFDEDINIIFDDTCIDRNNILCGNKVCIHSNNTELLEEFNEMISKVGGVFCDSYNGCSKFIYVCDLRNQFAENQVEEEMKFYADMLKLAFFENQRFASACIDSYMRGIMVNVIISDYEVQPYNLMVKGLAKKLGNKYMRINMIRVTEDKIKSAEGDIIFFLSRQSSHITGICINVEDKG